MKISLIISLLLIRYINGMDEPLLDLLDPAIDAPDVISITIPVAHNASSQAAITICRGEIRKINNKKLLCKNIIYCSIIGCCSLWIFLLVVNSTASYLMGL